MENVLEVLREEDDRIVEIFHGKEEWITEEVEASPTKPQIDETNTNQINTPHNVDPNNPYKDINLEKALWFHAHARGLNRHAGRIHYRMEYLARISGERVIKRRRIGEPETDRLASTQANGEDIVDPENEPPLNLDEMVLELQFIVPNPTNKPRVVDLWKITAGKRQQSREAGEFQQFLREFPVATAYDGELITIDFRMLKPSSTEFNDGWDTLEQKILTNHSALFRELTIDFVRALAIVRFKNPSRGSKRSRNEDAALNNPLSGIVKWIPPEDDFPQDGDNIPLLVVRGCFPEVSGGCAVCWGPIVIPVGGNIKTAFGVFLQCFDVFNVAPNPSDKNFFLFIGGAITNNNTLSTTGAKFLHGLQ
ncbi:hypothetical protein RP20_CCG004689 [Aedes albopictus]|nr:hypothetical protein RP20_CCG004689 [Aedes albopictus]